MNNKLIPPGFNQPEVYYDIGLMEKRIKELEAENSKIKNSIKHINKSLDELSKNMKIGAEASDEDILRSYNNVMPGFETTDVLTALRSLRGSHFLIWKQKIDDIKFLSEGVK